MKIDVKCFASLSTDDTCRHDQLRSITLGGENATIANLINQVQLPKKEIATVFLSFGNRGRLAGAVAGYVDPNEPVSETGIDHHISTTVARLPVNKIVAIRGPRRFYF